MKILLLYFRLLNRPRRLAAGWPLLAALLLATTAGYAQTRTFPAGFSSVQVVTGINGPTTMTFAPDGRIFVCEQQGSLRVVKDGKLLPAPFVSVKVFGADGSTGQGERGLIGVVCDPDFPTNHYIYLYYTLASGATNRIVRYTAAGDVAVAGSEKVILDLDPLVSATNHNGGAMHFGLDKKLYVAVGENTRRDSAQRLTSYFGKLLRLNTDGSAPSDNPFASSKNTHAQRVWSSGLRNPYTFAVEPGTGKIFINNVGEVSWEEINDASVGGRNFGWPTQPGGEGYTAGPGQTQPIYAYPHQDGYPDGTGCSITGGTFLSSPATNYPAQYKGKYFFMDYCGKWINYFDPTSADPRNSRQPFGQQVGQGDVVGLETGPDGNLYYLARNGQALFKIIYTAANTPPVITTQPASVTTSETRAVTLSVMASSASPLTYQWQKNGVNIAGATGSSYALAKVAKADAGTYRVVVTNSIGPTTSADATLTVKDFNTDPTAQITLNRDTYAANNVITFSGTATDKEDGPLPASAFTWEVLTHHNTHTHPFLAPQSGITSGSFTTADRGEVSDNIYYIVNLTVTDKAGQSITISRNVNPLKSTFTLATNPVGLSLTLDGTPQEPRAINVTGVQGIIREIGAPSGQMIGGKGVTYRFVSWSDGGAQTHEIATPTTNTTYTATFEPTTATTNTAPVAKILTPATSTTYAAGTTLAFSGDGTDKEDGALPASAYAWKVELIHADDNEVHTTTSFAGVKSGSYPIPTTEKETDVYYRVTLVVTDKAGQVSASAVAEVRPRTSTFSLATSPAGLSLTLDGRPQPTPAAIEGVEGIVYGLGAPSPQVLGGVSYEFVSWSDGQAQAHSIAVPTDDVTYTATFRAVPNTAPVAKVLTPSAGTTYVAGTTLAFSGDGTDKEDGALPASAYAWQVDLYRGGALAQAGSKFNVGAKTGSYTIPAQGETSADVFYRLTLTVTDAGGLTASNYVDVLPQKVTITLATSPAGLKLTLDGTAQATPASVVGVAGIGRTLGAPSPQTLNGTSYEFASWSDGGAQTHTITTPTSNVTYTASYKVVTTTPPASGQAVTSLVLFDADTDQPVPGFNPMPSTSTINLATLGLRRFSIRANTNPATVGSVQFNYDGNANYKVEGLAPYTIAGDNVASNGTVDYLPWTPAVGAHTLVVTPFTKGGASGTAGTPLSVSFTVKDELPANGPLRAPENPANTTAGLDYAYYQGLWASLPPFATLTPVSTGTAATFDLTKRLREDEFAFRFTGYVTVPADGVYTFYTNSDDGSQLFIGSMLLVDNDGMHGAQDRSGQIGLQAGTHALTVTYFNRGGGKSLSVSYAGPGVAKTLIPATALRRAAPASAAARSQALANASSSSPTLGADAEAVQLYPNPASNQVTVKLLAAVAGDVQVEVRDALARRVANVTQQASPGWNNVQLSLGALPTGVYSVTVQQGSTSTVRRLVVAP